MSVKVRFLRNYTVKAAGGPAYKEGQVVELSPESAKHFIDRHAAEEVEERKGPQPRPTRPDAKPE